MSFVGLRMRGCLGGANPLEYPSRGGDLSGLLDPQKRQALPGLRFTRLRRVVCAPIRDYALGGSKTEESS